MAITAKFRKVDQFGNFTNIGSNTFLYNYQVWDDYSENYVSYNCHVNECKLLQPMKNKIDPIKYLHLSMNFSDESDYLGGQYGSISISVNNINYGWQELLIPPKSPPIPAFFPLGDNKEIYDLLKQGNIGDEFIVKIVLRLSKNPCLLVPVIEEESKPIDTTLKHDMSKAFHENLEHTDVTLISATGQEIPCHKFILGARSPVFKAMFNFNGSSTATGQIEIPDASTEALKALRKYLYTDSVDNNDISQDLIALSDKYNLVNLQELCLPIFIKTIDIDNCLQMYYFGYLHNIEQIKTTAFNILRKNWKKFKDSSDLKELLKSYPEAGLEIINQCIV